MDSIDKNIAYNLKKIRKSQNMSLDMFAEKTHVSKSMLGQIERGESNPTVATIAKICEGLKITIEELVYREKTALSLVRKEQCRVVRNVQEKYEVKLVFPFEKHRDFEIYEITIEAGQQMITGAHGAHTTEYVTVSKGELFLTYDDETVTLKKGDAICLNANEEYRMENKGTESVQMNVVMTVTS